ncbi:porphobilinogen synthase [Glycomyces algeriensis]|uniref:Delta-aminolevulinic acid dehydratase n=1 Tax=Glycomyces algeriensis TaxID=256037 RepID=A0A9W6LE87_9ACTN|nr:porphobilinogen synthase [Glycomyces algeriensis]MDA1367647.1 porphobilinogen synthase [Glycomyces algeriensis]MDR7352988.1 porphobilinogen synthase [Glycomyces algeriensis]GLI40677.1 delta-aminolevulinic acid dehydratase [Glycomyces algeriensis]
MPNSPEFPVIRPRRLRRTAALRRLVAETRVHPSDLVLPVFVKEGLHEPVEIASMPGVHQHSVESVRKLAVEAARAGLGGLMPFGIPAVRDAIGSAATDPNGILNVTTRAIREEVGDDLVVIPDLCLDEFTDHGHCGVLRPDGTVDNDASLVRYAEMGVALAEAGADLLGASGMMDGQIGYVRAALDEAGHTDTGLLAYAAKYASAFYGPFRDAVESQLQGDRRTYQQDNANVTEALHEIDLDIQQGADIVMVKPALPYLDIVKAAAERSPVPVAAYHISGEYAQIVAAAERGWIDRDAAILESLTSIKRAGAGVIATYAAMEAAALLR